MKRNLTNPKSMSGFTLIELMTVVAIISILATLALPRFKRFQERARLTEAINMVSSIKESIEIFRLENVASPLSTGTAPLANGGTTRINDLGLLVRIPDDTYFGYSITTIPIGAVPASLDNLRVIATHPAGIQSTSSDVLSVNSNEEGVQFYKLTGSRELIPY